MLVRGTSVLAQKVTEYIHSAGGEVLTGTAVTQVDPYEHEVILSDGQVLRYKKLVWAADQKTLYTITSEMESQEVEKQRLLAAGYPDDEYFFLKLFDMSRTGYTRNPKSHGIKD